MFRFRRARTTSILARSGSFRQTMPSQYFVSSDVFLLMSLALAIASARSDAMTPGRSRSGGREAATRGSPKRRHSSCPAGVNVDERPAGIQLSSHEEVCSSRVQDQVTGDMQIAICHELVTDHTPRNSYAASPILAIRRSAPLPQKARAAPGGGDRTSRPASSPAAIPPDSLTHFQVFSSCDTNCFSYTPPQSRRSSMSCRPGPPTACRFLSLVV